MMLRVETRGKHVALLALFLVGQGETRKTLEKRGLNERTEMEEVITVNR